MPQLPSARGTFGQTCAVAFSQQVTSISVSPLATQAVLAAKTGLYIVDLDAPTTPPQHLALSSTWEVVDVQWNPFDAAVVASTSTHQALVWDVASEVPGVKLVLSRHARAVSDINWSNHHPQVVCA